MAASDICKSGLKSAKCLDDCPASQRRERIPRHGHAWLRNCFHDRILCEELAEPIGDTCVVQMRIARDDVHGCKTVLDAYDVAWSRDRPVCHADSYVLLAVILISPLLPNPVSSLPAATTPTQSCGTWSMNSRARREFVRNRQRLSKVAPRDRDRAPQNRRGQILDVIGPPSAWTLSSIMRASSGSYATSGRGHRCVNVQEETGRSAAHWADGAVRMTFAVCLLSHGHGFVHTMAMIVII